MNFEKSDDILRNLDIGKRKNSLHVISMDYYPDRHKSDQYTEYSEHGSFSGELVEKVLSAIIIKDEIPYSKKEPNFLKIGKLSMRERKMLGIPEDHPIDSLAITDLEVTILDKFGGIAQFRLDHLQGKTLAHGGNLFILPPEKSKI